MWLIDSLYHLRRSIKTVLSRKDMWRALLLNCVNCCGIHRIPTWFEKYLPAETMPAWPERGNKIKWREYNSKRGALGPEARATHTVEARSVYSEASRRGRAQATEDYSQVLKSKGDSLLRFWNCLGASDSFIQLLLFWIGNIHNCYPMPAPPLHFGNRQVVSDFHRSRDGKKLCHRLTHTRVRLFR